MHDVYIHDVEWWEYETPSSASCVWKCVCKVKEVFKAAYTQNNKWRDGLKA